MLNFIKTRTSRLLLIFLAAVFLHTDIIAQAPTRAQLTPVNTTGSNNKSGAFRVVLYIPLDTLNTTDSGAIAYVGDRLLLKNGSKWLNVGSAKQLTDSSFVIGSDTITIGGGIGKAWSLNGNVTDDPGNTFIGTVDGYSLRFRTADILRMVLDSASAKLSIVDGSDSLQLTAGHQARIIASPGTDLSLVTDNSLFRIGGAKKIVFGGIDNGGNPVIDSFLVRNPVDSSVKTMSSALFAQQGALNDTADALRSTIVAGTVTASGGIERLGNDVRLGGTLPGTTAINFGNTGQLVFQDVNALAMSSASGAFLFYPNQKAIQNTEASGFQKFQLGGLPDYGSIWQSRGPEGSAITIQLDTVSRLKITGLKNGGSADDSLLVISSSDQVKKRATATLTTTASGGLTKVGSDIRLGGTLPGSATVDYEGTGSFTQNNVSAWSLNGASSHGFLNFYPTSKTFHHNHHDGSAQELFFGAGQYGGSVILSTTNGSQGASFRMEYPGRYYMPTMTSGNYEAADSLVTWHSAYGQLKNRSLSSITGHRLSVASGALQLGGPILQNATIHTRTVTPTQSGNIFSTDRWESNTVLPAGVSPAAYGGSNTIALQEIQYTNTGAVWHWTVAGPTSLRGRSWNNWMTMVNQNNGFWVNPAPFVIHSLPLYLTPAKGSFGNLSRASNIGSTFYVDADSIPIFFVNLRDTTPAATSRLMGYQSNGTTKGVPTSSFVQTTGNQAVAGIKTFTDRMAITKGSGVTPDVNNLLYLGRNEPGNFYPLGIFEDATDDGYAQFGVWGKARKWNFGVGNGPSNFFGVQDKFYILDATSNNIRFAIDPDGKTGINTATPGTTLDVNGTASVTGAFTPKGNVWTRIQTVTSNTILDNTYHTVLIDASAGNVTITLPSAASCYNNGYGLTFILVRIDNAVSNTVIVNSSDIINGGPGSFIITTSDRYKSKTLQAASSTNWYFSQN